MPLLNVKEEVTTKVTSVYTIGCDNPGCASVGKFTAHGDDDLKRVIAIREWLWIHGPDTKDDVFACPVCRP